MTFDKNSRRNLQDLSRRNKTRSPVSLFCQTVDKQLIEKEEQHCNIFSNCNQKKLPHRAEIATLHPAEEVALQKKEKPARRMDIRMLQADRTTPADLILQKAPELDTGKI